MPWGSKGVATGLTAAAFVDPIVGLAQQVMQKLFVLGMQRSVLVVMVHVGIRLQLVGLHFVMASQVGN